MHAYMHPCHAMLCYAMHMHTRSTRSVSLLPTSQSQSRSESHLISSAGSPPLPVTDHRPLTPVTVILSTSSACICSNVHVHLYLYLHLHLHLYLYLYPRHHVHETEPGLDGSLVKTDRMDSSSEIAD
jgi:hypothetical protein